MKKFILAIATVLLVNLTGFSQDITTGIPGNNIISVKQNLNYDVQGAYIRPVKMKKLRDAKLISDIVDGYPTNWITSYDSVEILTTTNGIVTRAFSPKNVLSKEQKNLLNTVSLGSEIVINVKYKYKNPWNNKIENNNIHTAMTVVPEMEAQYIGGNSLLIKYLKENSFDKISESDFDNSHVLTIKFTVNEKGEIGNAKLTNTSKNPDIDKLLLGLINKMPNWKPAEDPNGKTVKQDFVFSLGNGC